MTGNRRFSRHRVTRFRSGAFEDGEAPVVSEVPLTVFLNGREVITLLASPDALDYLAVGFLKSEGMLGERADITKVEIDPVGPVVRIESTGTDPFAEGMLERRTITSGCGKGTTFYHAFDALQVKTPGPGPPLRPEEVLELMRALHRRSELYRAAGGVHSAALCTPGGIEIFRDDIGRHNAIDKIHGECFLRGLDMENRILITTGRISSEILIKAGKIGVPVIVSRSGPTALALDLAERIGVTVIGRVRGGELTVYSHPRRLEGP